MRIPRPRRLRLPRPGRTRESAASHEKWKTRADRSAVDGFVIKGAYVATGALFFFSDFREADLQSSRFPHDFSPYRAGAPLARSTSCVCLHKEGRQHTQAVRRSRLRCDCFSRFFRSEAAALRSEAAPTR